MSGPRPFPTGVCQWADECGRRATVSAHFAQSGSVVEFCELHFGTMLAACDAEGIETEPFACAFRDGSADLTGIAERRCAPAVVEARP